MASTAKIATTTTATQVPPKGPEAAFPPFDASGFSAQLIWLALTFGFLYFALSRALLPRIADVMNARQDGISRDLAKAEQLKTETEQALASYEKALADAKSKAGEIARATRDSLAAETERERLAVERQIATQVAAAEKRIADSKTKAMASVGDIATETVSAIVGKLTGADLSKADAAKAIAAIRK
jgi:F-type H+-transporting ATPase subunit b